MKKVHIDELRAALDEARNALALSAISYGETITANTTTVRAAHVLELEGGVR